MCSQSDDPSMLAASATDEGPVAEVLSRVDTSTSEGRAFIEGYNFAIRARPAAPVALDVQPLSSQEIFAMRLRAADHIEQQQDLFSYAAQATEDRARLLATLAALSEPSDD